MGCASSRRIDVAGDVYRPLPTSFAVFDVNAVEEPWLIANGHAQQEKASKISHVPDLILNTLDNPVEAPQSWAEVSKALEKLKPTLDASVKPIPPTSPPKEAAQTQAQFGRKPPKNLSFHTVEELEVKVNPDPNPKPNRHQDGLRPAPESTAVEARPIETESGYKPLKENIFIVRDRLEREKEGKQSSMEKMMSWRRDPLSEFPEKCPPGGSEMVVIYTTSLGGIRRTFEECNKVRDILEWHRAVFDERDVALHGEYLKELKELVGEEGRVPRMFVKGRYVGGMEEVVELNETGRLGRILNAARVERGVGRQTCQGCGGARFVPCFECGGSCKVTLEKDGDGDDAGNVVGMKDRCPKCNENGLVHCPTCL